MTPDTKDWTWVLQERCPECGFDAGDLHREDIGTRVLLAARELGAALGRPDVRTRPDPQVWSPLEYGCHARDVCRLFDSRLEFVLTEDDPMFADWDQDAAAVQGDYAGQDPVVVGAELWEAAQVLAGRFNGVSDPHWDRTAVRSDGARFSVVTLGQYLVHDLVHHVWDLTGVPQPT